jgi:membrane fusion protein, multidrug efflux system
MKPMKHLLSAALMISMTAAYSLAQAIELVPVVKKAVSRTVDLPGEFQPFMIVTLSARVPGYVENVLVDRGSVVKQGDSLVTLSAPEMKAQIAGAESRVQAADADRLQAEARLASLEATLTGAQATYNRLKTASVTPGVIAGNELDIALQNVESQRAGIQAQRSSIDALRNKKVAAEAELSAVREMERYLKVTAPFDGVVSERSVHPGALVGPSVSSPLLTLQQVSRLRLVVSVPEEHVGGIVRGGNVPFGVPAYPTRMFSGTVARIPPSLDTKTRSMPVELDVTNKDQLLAPGMYSTVHWPVRSADGAFFVPKTAIVTTTERTFVVREKNGRAEWVNVQKGAADGDLIRVTGPIQEGDIVVKRATDEMREGMTLKAGVSGGK